MEALKSKLFGEVLTKRIKKDNRIRFEVRALGLTAYEWFERLKKGGYKLTDGLIEILSNTDYDENHRYEAGKILKVVLIRAKEIKKDSEKITENFKAIAEKNFGKNSVSDLKGELLFLIREKFTNKELKEMGTPYIFVLHEPIIDFHDDPNVLELFHDEKDNSWVGAEFNHSHYEYGAHEAFAFLED